MIPHRFSLVSRIKSFRYAFNGLRILLKEEHNFRIHLFALIVVLVTGYCVNLSTLEWGALVLAMGLVITAEIINTVLENMSDLIAPKKNSVIKKIKDIAAAGVLVSAITALLVGILIFLPKLTESC